MTDWKRIESQVQTLAVALALLWCNLQYTHAQLPVVAETRLGVDSVKLESGQRLYGFVLGRQPDGAIELAVERKWLEATYPQLAEELIQLDEQRAAEAGKLALERAEVWLKHRAADRGLAIFIENGIKAIEAKAADPKPELLFVRIQLKPGEFSDMKLQPPDRRQIAGLAWQKRLDAVTTTPVSMLEKKLVALGVDVKTTVVDLSREVSPILESERQWCARKGLVEHQLRKPLEYQGTGTMLVRKSEQPDVGAVIGQMLGGGAGGGLAGGGLDALTQLGADLGLPEFKQLAGKQDEGWKRVTAEAERDGFCGVLVNRMTQSPLSPEVSVELSFYAMEKPGNWFLVHRLVSTANADQQTEERIQQIQSDPQIKSLLDTLTGLGLGVDQSLLDRAIRHGAATQAALQSGTGLFNQFLLQYTRDIDGPAIPIAAGP